MNNPSSVTMIYLAVGGFHAGESLRADFGAFFASINRWQGKFPQINVVKWSLCCVVTLYGHLNIISVHVSEVRRYFRNVASLNNVMLRGFIQCASRGCAAPIKHALQSWKRMIQDNKLSWCRYLTSFSSNLPISGIYPLCFIQGVRG